jgi:hypothetical protein
MVKFYERSFSPESLSGKVNKKNGTYAAWKSDSESQLYKLRLLYDPDPSINKQKNFRKL